MAKSSKDLVQDFPRTGLGIPIKTKNPSLEPIHRPRKSAIKEHYLISFNFFLSQNLILRD